MAGSPRKQLRRVRELRDQLETLRNSFRRFTPDRYLTERDGEPEAATLWRETFDSLCDAATDADMLTDALEQRLEAKVRAHSTEQDEDDSPLDDGDESLDAETDDPSLER